MIDFLFTHSRIVQFERYQNKCNWSFQNKVSFKSVTAIWYNDSDTIYTDTDTISHKVPRPFCLKLKWPTVYLFYTKFMTFDSLQCIVVSFSSLVFLYVYTYALYVGYLISLGVCIFNFRGKKTILLFFPSEKSSFHTVL